jgi:type IX secretion system PorP/SprF family membrane protein
LAINPAYAGVHDFITITGNVREQWAGLKGAPSTQTLSASAPIMNDQFGLGLIVINDKVGVRSQQEVSVNYSYKLRFPDYTLMLGLKLGFNTIKNNFNELYLDEELDENFQENSTVFSPVVGFGAYFKARDYYIGLSVPQLYKFVRKKYDDYNIDRQQIIFLTGGYIFRLSEDFKLRPSVLTKARIGGAFEMDLNANVYFKDDYCFGLSYKSLNSLALIFEVGIRKTYYIGYSYDFATSKLINYQTGTHEFSVNVYLNREDKTRVVNPRYF